MFICLVGLIIWATYVIAMDKPAKQSSEHCSVIIHIDHPQDMRPSIDITETENSDFQPQPTENKKHCKNDKVKLALIAAATTITGGIIGAVVTLIVHFTN